jgi:hypothetical protein
MKKAAELHLVNKSPKRLAWDISNKVLIHIMDGKGNILEL